jgi:hypothetical protein
MAPQVRALTVGSKSITRIQSGPSVASIDRTDIAKMEGPRPRDPAAPATIDSAQTNSPRALGQHTKLTAAPPGFAPRRTSLIKRSLRYRQKKSHT